MTPLKTIFRRDSIDFRQIRREGRAAVYELTKPIWSTGRYETVVILHHKGRRVGGPSGVDLPPSEGYPSTNQWGRLGWSYPEKSAALAKFRELVDKQAKRDAKGD